MTNEGAQYARQMALQRSRTPAGIAEAKKRAELAAARSLAEANNIKSLRDGFFQAWENEPTTYVEKFNKYQHALGIQNAHFHVSRSSQRYPVTTTTGFRIFTESEMKTWQGAYMHTPEYAALTADSGGMFGGFISSIVNPIAQVAQASLQVATLGNANAVIKPLQEVARNPIVQAVAVGALTVYTGGLAAAAMGGGAVATAGGTMLASAAVGKAQGQSFNLQKSLVTGATAGVGEYAKGAELLSNATANAAAVSSLTNAVQNKLQGKAFNLQDTLQAGAESWLAKWGAPKGDASISIMPIPNPVADFVQGAKAVYQLKQAVDTMHNQQAQADQAKAVAQQQTAQINADQAHIDAVKKEIAALEAQAAQAKQSPQQQPQTSTAQTYTASEKMAAASVLLGLLKLFA